MIYANFTKIFIKFYVAAELLELREFKTRPKLFLKRYFTLSLDCFTNNFFCLTSC